MSIIYKSTHPPRTRTDTHTHARAHTHIHTHACARARARTHSHRRIHARACVRARTSALLPKHTHTHPLTHLHPHTRARTHIHTPLPLRLLPIPFLTGPLCRLLASPGRRFSPRLRTLRTPQLPFRSFIYSAQVTWPSHSAAELSFALAASAIWTRRCQTGCVTLAIPYSYLSFTCAVHGRGERLLQLVDFGSLRSQPIPYNSNLSNRRRRRRRRVNN